MKAPRWPEGAAFSGKDVRAHDGRYRYRSVRAVGQNTAVMESVVIFLSAHIGDAGSRDPGMDNYDAAG